MINVSARKIKLGNLDILESNVWISVTLDVTELNKIFWENK